MTAATKQQKKTFADAAEILRNALPPGAYEERPQQVKMARAIEIVLGAEWDGESLPPTVAVQAGCGTGKSHALLIPAGLSGKRVVISTSTKALQHQIVAKDAPFLVEHLPNFPEAVLVMGRGNYLCGAKLAEGPDIPQLTELQAVQADKDHEGTRETIDFDITTEQWAQVSSTGTECPGAKACPFAADCKAEAAKKRAAEAKLIITNVACLGLDMLFAEMGDTPSGPMLGKYDLLMCDEADGLDSALRNVLATKLNERGLMGLAEQTQSFIRNYGKMDGDTLKESVALTKAVQGLNASLPQIYSEDRPLDDPKGDELNKNWFAKHEEPVNDLIRALDAISDVLGRVGDDGLDLKQKNRKRMLRAQADNGARALRAASAAEDDEMARFNTWNVVRAEGARRGLAFFTVEFHPVSIADRLRENLWSKQPTVFTSATLTTAPDDFSFFTRTIGVEHAATLDVGTPFDYPNQAKMFISGPECPPPDKEHNIAWTSYAINQTYKLVKMAGGGALLLYTSRDAMMNAHQVLAEQLQRDGFTVLLQDGTVPTGELGRRFREDVNSVLFGLKSFFVGLDVPGDSLRLVVMDKLPFPVPVEPVFKARSKALEKAGRSSFHQLSIPMMVLDLVQGFGRLIRTKSDRGVVAILDSRLWSKSYGPQVLATLPDCVAEIDDSKIEAFFQEMMAAQV